MMHRCDNCLRVFTDSQLKPIKDLAERVSPGETVPYGKCPDCGALCQRFDAYTDAAILSLKSFANGFIQGWIDRAGDEPIEDHWVMFSEGIDINFDTNNTECELRAFAYHRTYRPVVGDHDIDDEVRLI